MPKFILFLVAVFWAGVITYFCLVPSTDLPAVNIQNLDKYIHVFFHFVFTFVWFLFFYKQLKTDSILKPFLISMSISILFGIMIEILQSVLTTTRSADFIDVLANFLGASLAFLLIVICMKNNILNIVLKK